MESVSGMSLNDVSVHRNSDKPAQLQAHAYAQGTDVHLAPGQEKHLPHELGHVVQQKQGRVAPTVQLKGQVPVNDSPSLEKEADTLGAKAKSLGASAEVSQLKVMEEEEPVQGKFVGTAQRKAAEEEEVLQGKFDGIAQRKAAEEEEVLQGKFEGVAQREELEGAAAVPEAAAPEAEEEKAEPTEMEETIAGIDFKYTSDPEKKLQTIEGSHEDSGWSVTGTRELKDEAKNLYEYSVTGAAPSVSASTSFNIPLAVIPLGVPGLSATINLSGSLAASASGEGTIKFLYGDTGFSSPSATGTLKAGVEAGVELQGGVTAGIPGVLGVTGGAYGSLTGKIDGALSLTAAPGGLTMSSELSGSVTGEAGIFASANALWYTKEVKLPLSEGTLGEFKGTKENVPFSKDGLKSLANISSYNFERDKGNDAKTDKSRKDAAGEVKEEAKEKQKTEVVEKGKEKKPWYQIW